MRKLRIAAVVLVCLLLLAALGVGASKVKVVRGAETDHDGVYGQYSSLLDSARRSTLTVTENGETVGVYTLEDLGLLDGVQAALDRQFSQTDRLTQNDFHDLSFQEKLAWGQRSHPSVSAVPVDAQQLDASAVLRDLNQTPRSASQDAYVSLEDGRFRIVPEVSGRVLREDVVLEALKDAASITVQDAQPAAAAVELTDYDCYLRPEITVENGGFDFSALLAEALSRMSVTLRFREGAEVLSGDALAALVRVEESGTLTLQPALEDYLLRCAEDHRAENQPYMFDSYATGPVAIDFLRCTYAVDTDGLRAALTEALQSLKSADIEVPYLVTDGVDDGGRPFSLGDTYVEVDIAKQQMTFYQNGELIVHTDVVTGFRNWRETPTGFYTVQNKDTDCWLTGPDFNVHVDYWVGFIGTLYGIHDASWRTEFGGMVYAQNGSHGCVNTPSEAMQPLYEAIEIGTPVLVYDVERDS